MASNFKNHTPTIVAYSPRPEYPASLLDRSGNPVYGDAGIGILAFHLLEPVPLSAGREFHKIVTRFYFFLNLNSPLLAARDEFK
jgi:hypothetical protein